jgi:succinoglycan biosynthesis transport protein ExoP
MTFQQFFLALRYRWKTAFAVLAATMLAVVLLASLLVPTRYRATSELLIEEANSDPIAGVALPGSSLPSRIMTEADIVRSERVLLRALRAMDTPYQRGMRERWQSLTGGQGDFNGWLVEELQRTTEVRPTRESQVLVVAHSASDPHFAASFVNALTKAYIETAVELRVEPARQYSAFFDERARQMREQLFEAQRRASEFQRRNGITTIDDKSDVEDAHLAEVSAQVVALQARAGEAQRRQSEAAAGPDRMEEVLRDPTVASLASALALQETKLFELVERQGSNHPHVVEARAATDNLAKRLEAAKRRAATGFQGNSTVLASQLAERTRALEVQREKVLERKALRNEARLLQNDVEVARRAFDAVVDRLSKTTLEKSAPQVNVSILKVASVPSMATSASLAPRLAVGAVAGLLLALISIVVAGMRDRRLLNANDVLSELDQPVLAVLSSPARTAFFQPQPALARE